MSNQKAAAVFDALGDPTRRHILELLRDGPVPVGVLAASLPVGRPAVSKHLKALGDAGLVTRHSVGTRNLYALAPGGLDVAQRWLADTWDVALRRFADAVEQVADDRKPTARRSRKTG